MGIDIYARWPDQTEAETDAQCTGFSIEHGHTGYLREAYHGEPYATRVLVPEAFDDETYPDGATIPAETLRERLSVTLAVARHRQQLVYNEGPEHENTRVVLQSFRDFVALCELRAQGARNRPAVHHCGQLLTEKPRRGLAGPLNPNMHRIP